MAGRVGLLQQWQQLLQDVEIDWEEAISQYLRISWACCCAGIRMALGWTQQRRAQGRLLGGSQELRLPAPWSRALYADVAQVAQETERLAARIHRLHSVGR